LDKKQAIQFLRGKLNEIDHLASLPYNNPEHRLWRNQIEDVLEEVFGRTSTEYIRFHETRRKLSRDYPQRGYLKLLQDRETEILSIIRI